MLPPEIFDAIRRIKPGAGGEIQLTDAMALLLAEGAPVHGIVYRGTRYDTGLPLGYLQAVVQIACRARGPRSRVQRVAAELRPAPNFGTRQRIEAMTAQTTLAPTPELTPLADYLAGVLQRLRPLPPLDLDLTQAYGNVLAEDVRAPHRLPAFDHAAIDGYAARCEDLLGAAAEPAGPAQRGRRPGRRPAGGRSGSRPAPASRSRPARRCRPPPTSSCRRPGPTRAWPRWRSSSAPKRGYGVRRAGDEIPAGAISRRPART